MGEHKTFFLLRFPFSNRHLFEKNDFEYCSQKSEPLQQGMATVEQVQLY